MRWFIILLSALLAAACDNPSQANYQPTLSTQDAAPTRIFRVGIHPLHNPQRLMELYGPIVDHLNAAIPEYQLQLEASRNYEEFEKKLYGGEFDFAMPNPYQTVLSLRHGYRVIAKMADDSNFRGVILVRKDSGIRSVADLKGKAVSYPAATALAATMLPQYYLHTHGLDVTRDIQNLYVGSQESSILSVQRGHVAAGATWPVPWLTFQEQQPELAAQLEVKWQTDTLPNNAWVARKDLPPPLVARFTELLLGLKDSAQGRQMLHRLPVTAFEKTTAETYQPVRAFLQAFSAQIRPIEQ